MKKALSLLLILVMLLGMMPMTAFATEEAEKNPWEGRSAVFVGDSITAGSGTTKLYYRFLEESLGFGSVTGMGIGGSCISSGSDYGNNNTPLINRYKDIPSADLIQIFMGTNDYGHATPIGSPEDTQAGTFYGALNTIIPYLLETHKESKIALSRRCIAMQSQPEPHPKANMILTQVAILCMIMWKSLSRSAQCIVCL